MADKKPAYGRLYTKPEVRELGTGEAQSIALLTLIAKAATGSLNTALHSVAMQIALVREQSGQLDRTQAERLEMLAATAARAVRLCRVIYGSDPPTLDEAYSNHVEEHEEACGPAD